MQGFDLTFVRSVTSSLTMPVIAGGGCGSLLDIKNVLENGETAAGSFFIFHGPYKAVLINYPPREELEKIFTTS